MMTDMKFINIISINANIITSYNGLMMISSINMIS